MKPASNNGFTLVEISIVLVVIGLLVGGILVGRDLINAAELRGTISQIQKYNSAVNTFHTKFGGLPGDLSPDLAVAFGFTNRAGTQGRGDGNGLIDGINEMNNNQCFNQESAMFWNDLSVANLIDGHFTGAKNQDFVNPPTVLFTDLPTMFPAAKLGRNNYVIVGSIGSGFTESGTNYFMIMGFQAAGIDVIDGGAGFGIWETTLGNITPIEAYNIDMKMDDGMPNTGIVQNHGNSVGYPIPFSNPGNWQAAPGIWYCTMGGTSATDPADTYNLTPANGGTNQTCMLRFRFN